MKSVNVEFQPYVDYVQSANTLFHFMKKFEYLKTILTMRAIVPRYCVETMDYLNITNDENNFSEVAVLQKCFCDIPLHKLADTFSVTGTGVNFSQLNKDEKFQVEHNNTHFDFYGRFAIGFSKDWSERNKLQPIHYLNTASNYSCHLKNLISASLSSDDVPDVLVEDVLYRLAFIKPLRGVMQRSLDCENQRHTAVDIYKNFHDECEWRFVPNSSIVVENLPGNIIADKHIVESEELLKTLNERVAEEKNNCLWLRFDFDEIRYLIVPEASDRIDLIDAILELPEEIFGSKDNINRQKQVLISKILVLSEIRRDW